MRTKKHLIRTAVITGAAGMVLSGLAPATASAATDEASGHKICPAGQQVRVWSFTQGDTVTHYWFSDNGTHGNESRDIGMMGEDTQTFTLQRDVYWRVVVEGEVDTHLAAGAECY